MSARREPRAAGVPLPAGETPSRAAAPTPSSSAITPARPLGATLVAGGPVIAIAGRPNAGKSTLFNRLLRRRRAIVDETPGVTRDENRAELVYDDRRYQLVDTGGIEELAGEGLAGRVHERSVDVLRRADVIVHLVDGKAGISSADEAVARNIRALGLPTILAVNKIDREDQRPRIADFAALGADEAIAVSSAHGLGVEELWDGVERALARVGKLPARPGDAEEEGDGAATAGDGAAGARSVVEVRESFREAAPAGEVETPEAVEPDASTAVAELPPRVALIGRPNVGKSSILNRLVGFERALVDSTPGTTRDSLDVAIERAGRRYVIVDTAGLRRPSRIVETIEGYAAAASLRAIDRCEVAVLVLDATLGVSDQDMRLADLVWRRGRGFIVAVNKVDLAPELAAQQCHDTIAERLPQWPPLPLVRVSALQGTGLKRLFTAVDTVVTAYRRRIPTPRLNEIVGKAVEAHPPPLVRGKLPKLLYAAQVRSSPQEIALVAGHPEGLTTEYRRYLMHRVREEFGLVGVPVRMIARERSRSAARRVASESGDAGASPGAGARASAPERARAGRSQTAPGAKGRAGKPATRNARRAAQKARKPHEAKASAPRAGKPGKPGKVGKPGSAGAKGARKAGGGARKSLARGRSRR